MISQSRYINIISGVGAGAAVAQRQLVIRLVTQNPLLAPGIVMEFSNADDVGSIFGITSEEYARAVIYFAFISKSARSPAILSFARWVNIALAPTIVGDSTTKNLAALKQQAAGTMTINDGATVVQVGPINFSAATDLTSAAAIVQSALRATADSQLTASSVTYNTNTSQFVLTGSTTGAGSLTVTPTGVDTDVSAALGWGTSGTTYVPGQAADTAVAAITKSEAISNNFGSFAFCTPTTAPTNEDLQAVAAWNASKNNQYMYLLATTIANAASLYADLGGYAGTGIMVKSATLANDFIEQLPGEIMAATNYNGGVNAVQNYMFYQSASRNVTVSDDATANAMDLVRANYIGVTQSAGQQVAFFQRGVLCGGSTSPTDMNTFANEIWLKSAIFSNILNLFLSSPNIAANDVGSAQILAVLQSVISTAKTNGVISAGKTLTTAQQQYITQITGDANAYRQVATLGYWITVSIEPYTTTDRRTEWRANYVLVYGKGDAIRAVEGSDILI